MTTIYGSPAIIEPLPVVVSVPMSVFPANYLGFTYGYPPGPTTATVGLINW